MHPVGSQCLPNIKRVLKVLVPIILIASNIPKSPHAYKMGEKENRTYADRFLFNRGVRRLQERKWYPKLVNENSWTCDVVYQWQHHDDRDPATDTPTHFQFVPGKPDWIAAMLESGEIRLWYGLDKSSYDFKAIVDIKDQVWAQISAGGFVFDPDWPSEPYIYMRYRGAPCGAELPNTLITTSSQREDYCRAWWCPKRYDWSGKAENNQYCNINSDTLCETFETVARIKMNPDTMDMISRTTLARFACSSQFSHTRQQIEILKDKSLAFGVADNSPAGATYDEGSESRDGCFNSKVGYPQGVFRPQLGDEFQQGKFFSIPPSVYRYKSHIKHGDYEVLAKGLRQPFSFAANKITGAAEVGDVGDGDGNCSERFYTIGKKRFINAGWPCVEGKPKDETKSGKHRPGGREISRKEWLKSKQYTVCDGVYKARENPNQEGADPNFVEANFCYRDMPTDVDYSGCGYGGAAVTSVFHYTGDAMGTKYKNALFFADYVRNCVFYFKGHADGSFDWSKPRVVIDGEKEKLGPSHIQSSSDGSLYFLDYHQDRMLRCKGSSGTSPTLSGCSTGKMVDDVCCGSSCEACGGSGCAGFNGGHENCCAGSIRDSGRFCSKDGPPCVIDEAPSPTPIPSGCSTGKMVDDVCCASSCEACGGSGCAGFNGGHENCCAGSIRDSGRFCSKDGPPCVIDEAPSPTPIPSGCSTGKMVDNVCCASSCEACGGSGCAGFNGGHENCCVGSIRNSGRFCSKDGPPCVIDEAPSPTPIPSGCSTGKMVDDVCCASSCEACGGSGCTGFNGGHENCCAGSIRNSGRFCSDDGPPCIMDGNGIPQPPPTIDVCQGSAPEEVSWNLQADGSYETTVSIKPITYSNAHGTTTTRAYDSSIPGRVMRMKAGGVYHVTLNNDHDLSSPNSPAGITNTFQEPCTTNFHTHGLHISPKSPADDVSVAIEPGESYTYTYTIPPDHSGGTHFIHAHHHGSTALQIFNYSHKAGAGAVAVLVIDDNHQLNEVTKPSVWPTNMPEIIVALQLMTPDLTSYIAGTSGDTVYHTTATNDHYLVNGCDGSSYRMELVEGLWHRVRMLHVGREHGAIVRITPDGSSPACKIGILAFDGIYLETAPRWIVNNGIFLSVAGRLDFLIRCPGAGSHTLHVLDSSTEDTITTSKVEVASSSGTWDDERLNNWNPVRPPYLQSLLSASGVESGFTVDLGYTNQINGAPFKGFANDEDALATVDIDTVQEWRITNSLQHPFHMHVNHMQLTEGSFTWGRFVDHNFMQAGDWLDTITSSSIVTVRWKPERYGGIVPLHCHVYEHAERGMLGFIVINGGYGPSGEPELPDSHCATGIRSGNACCLQSCGSCGGFGCHLRDGGSTGCCTGDITANGRNCDSDGPPCNIQPSSSWPVSCTEVNGILGEHKTCCKESCLTCGGPGCHLREGGSDGCCNSQIQAKPKVMCGMGVLAPCMLP